MKTLLVAILTLSIASSTLAATTTNVTNKFSYGANIGWMDWRSNLLIKS